MAKKADMKYERLQKKNLDQQLKTRIEKGMGCAPFVSEAILEAVNEVYFPLLSLPDHIKPGKLYFQCISKEEPSTRHMSDAQLTLVILTLDAGESDLAIRKEHGVQRLRQERISRMCSEAYNQGGLLTVEDLAYKLFNVGERTIVRDLKTMRERGENPPLRSTIKDMGRTISHKNQIIKGWLMGDELSDLKRKHNHSLAAIENYINTFKRIIFLSSEGKKIEQIAYVLKISQALAKSHLTLWEECSENALPHRKNELKRLIKSESYSKKK